MYRHKELLGFCLASFLFFAACGSSSNSPGVSVQETITPEGGEVVLQEAGVRLSVPPGAVADDINVKITVVKQTVAGSPVTELYKLEPSGIVFETPVTLTINVAEEMRSENLYLAKVVDGRPLGVKGFNYNQADGTLTAELYSFSIYGGFSFSDDEDCEECTWVNCGTEVVACENDIHCDAILDCYDSCYPDELQWECIDMCVGDHPDGEFLFDNLYDCTYENCNFCIDRDEDIIDMH